MVSDKIVRKGLGLGIHIYEPEPNVIRFSNYGEVLSEMKLTKNGDWIGYLYPAHPYLVTNQVIGSKNFVANQCLFYISEEVKQPT